MEKENNLENAALSFLPMRLQNEIRKTSALYKGKINEIRLRVSCPVFITVQDKNIQCNAICTFNEMYETVRTLSGNSLYCHSETIKEGYISTAYGIRAAVCGRAVTENGKILTVTDISSVSIRIPHRVENCADDLLSVILKSDFKGMLIYSPPGVGKTTVLREICAKLGSKPFYKRICVVDTRYEICGALDNNISVDLLNGYPRAKGIEIAVRCFSPQLIVCDEIGNSDDADAILQSMGSGVPCIVSAHADNFKELTEKENINKLILSGAFSCYVGLSRDGEKTRFNYYSEEKAC